MFEGAIGHTTESPKESQLRTRCAVLESQVEVLKRQVEVLEEQNKDFCRP